MVKLLLQEVWRANLEWDILPSHLLEKWKNFNLLKTLNIQMYLNVIRFRQTFPYDCKNQSRTREANIIT